MTHPPHGDLAVQPGQPQPAHAGDDFIDAPPSAADVPWPPPGTFPDEQPAFSGDQYPPFPDEHPTVGIPAYQESYADQTQLVETGWKQPEPTEPWHARHERPGEWQTQPPEHLSFEHSPPAEVQPGVQGHHAAGYPAHAHAPHAPSQPIHVSHQPFEAPLLPMEPEPTRQRRSGLWVSLALVVTLLLCGGGATSAYLLLRDADTGTGAPDPSTAVNRFLTAVYTQQDAKAANDMVCRESRDQGKLTGRINQIKGYAAEYDNPSFRWTEPTIATQGDKVATVGVQLTMATDDEKQAQQQLTFTVTQKTGWRVCDIAAG